MMIPLPFVNKAYSMIISNESQRVTTGSYSRGDLGISTALYIGKDQRQYTGEGSYSGGDACASTSTDLYAGRGHQQSALYKPKRDYNLQCEVCKIKGHTKETCYRVVRYPPDYKFKKKSGNNANRMANVNAVENESLGQTPPTFTQEQYGQILRLLNKENFVIPEVNQASMDL
ncbi:hypothetical protein KY285_008504 [Solanum tuberosum]|nr:hypothetical protein KY285_008504 [Solanum tuberosum]